MRTNTAQKIMPDGWKQAKLRDLSKKIGSGVTPKGGQEVYTTEGIYFLRSQNVQNGYLDLSDVAYISDLIDAKMKSSSVYEGDILYNITGASIGRTAVYTLSQKANVNQHVCIVRLKQDNPKFVHAQLLSKAGADQLYSFQAGGNRQGLNYQQLGCFKLFLPPLPEQNRIVAVLETWDKAIEKLEKKIEIKKKIKKGLMHELLTGTKRIHGFNQEWIYSNIESLCKTSSGGTPRVDTPEYYENGTIPWLKSGEVRKGRIKSVDNYITDRGLKNSSAKIFPSKTVLIAMYGATAGQVGILEVEACTNQAICGLLPNNNIYPDFIYFLLSTKISQLLALCAGAAQPNISQDIIRDFDLYIPPTIEEQKAIADILTAADNEIEKLQIKLSFLKIQKKYLLNNLITGTIRTPEDLKIN